MTSHREDPRFETFEAHCGHLRTVAYRMLGSLGDAEDAVQEAWIRLQRSDTAQVADLRRWLTTVVARVCLDMLRSRRSRREAPPEEAANTVADGVDPEHETAMADAVGLAMLVVLETLGPAERIAFVLHDMFAMSFDEIAPLVERTPTATRQLASRARRRVRGVEIVRAPDLDRQRRVVDAFLAAARAGDFDGLLAVLHPDVVLRNDGATLPDGEPTLTDGAETIARRAIHAGARAARAALVDGHVGLVIAPSGRLLMIIRLAIRDGRITEFETIGDPERIARMQLAVLDD